MSDDDLKIAVVQIQGGILGVGDDEDAAIKDALCSGASFNDDEAACMEFIKSDTGDGACHLARVSEALAHEIDRHGIGVPWTMLAPGLIGTPEEGAADRAA